MSDGSYRYQCEPAATVIRALGGVRALAGALGVTPELVSKWNRPAVKEGTGGFIPPKHWPATLRIAQALGAGGVTEELLAQGQRERLDMGKSAKVKGDRFEFEVVRQLVTAGFDAHRVPLSGAVKGYPGDVRIDTPSRVWILQCKISGRNNSSGRTVVTRALHGAIAIRVVTKGAVYIGMQREVFYGLLKGLRPDIVNMPEMKTSGEQIGQAIKGHDALVFRRDGVTAWHAMVLESTYLGAK